MSVYKPAKSRYFHYDFQFKGRRFHGSTGVETRRKAEEAERRLRARAAAGEDLDDPLTLDQAAGRWWLEVGQHLRTAVDVERRLGVCLRLLGKDRPLTEISTKVLAKAIEKRRGETYAKAPDRPAQNGRPARKARRYPVSNATVNADLVGVFRRIHRRAQATWEVKGLPPIDWKALTLPEPPPKVRYYTAAQRQAWKAECDPTAADALTLLLTYGLRLKELFFPPQAFDAGLGAGPSGEAEPRLILNSRKADVPHVVELRADDARMIAARAGRAIADGKDTIWLEQDGRRLVPVTYYGLQSRLNSAARRAGIDGGRLIHGARHHAGTDALRRSGNLKLTQQLLGHRDIKSTLRYAHALQQDLRALVESEARAGEATAAAEFDPPQVPRRRTHR